MLCNELSNTMDDIDIAEFFDMVSDVLSNINSTISSNNDDIVSRVEALQYVIKKLTEYECIESRSNAEICFKLKADVKWRIADILQVKLTRELTSKDLKDDTVKLIIDYYIESENEFQSMYGTDSIRALDVRLKLADFYFSQCRYTEAKTLLQESLLLTCMDYYNDDFKVDAICESICSNTLSIIEKETKIKGLWYILCHNLLLLAETIERSPIELNEVTDDDANNLALEPLPPNEEALILLTTCENVLNSVIPSLLLNESLPIIKSTDDEASNCDTSFPISSFNENSPLSTSAASVKGIGNEVSVNELREDCHIHWCVSLADAFMLKEWLLTAQIRVNLSLQRVDATLHLCSNALTQQRDQLSNAVDSSSSKLIYQTMDKLYKAMVQIYICRGMHPLACELSEEHVNFIRTAHVDEDMFNASQLADALILHTECLLVSIPALKSRTSFQTSAPLDPCYPSRYSLSTIVNTYELYDELVEVSALNILSANQTVQNVPTESFDQNTETAHLTTILEYTKEAYNILISNNNIEVTTDGTDGSVNDRGEKGEDEDELNENEQFTLSRQHIFRLKIAYILHFECAVLFDLNRLKEAKTLIESMVSVPGGRSLQSPAGVSISLSQDMLATFYMQLAQVSCRLAIAPADYEECLSFIHHCYILRRTLNSTVHHHVADSKFLRGIICREAGLLQTSEETFQIALSEYTSLFGHESVQVADCIIQLALIFIEQENFESAKKKYLEAIKIYTVIAEVESDDNNDSSMSLIKAQFNLASLYDDCDDLANAERHYIATLKLLQKQNCALHPLMSQCLMGLGGISETRGNTQDAYQLRKEAVDIDQLIQNDKQTQQQQQQQQVTRFSLTKSNSSRLNEDSNMSNPSTPKTVTFAGAGAVEGATNCSIV